MQCAADRKRDLQDVYADERRAAVQAHVADEQARLDALGVAQPMRPVPEVDAFAVCFSNLGRVRRPVLAIVGGTNLGKHMLAAHVLRRASGALGVPDFLEVTV